jgi:hypothetical protein
LPGILAVLVLLAGSSEIASGGLCGALVGNARQATIEHVSFGLRKMPETLKVHWEELAGEIIQEPRRRSGRPVLTDVQLNHLRNLIFRATESLPELVADLDRDLGPQSGLLRGLLIRYIALWTYPHYLRSRWSSTVRYQDAKELVTKFWFSHEHFIVQDLSLPKKPLAPDPE